MSEEIRHPNILSNQENSPQYFCLKFADKHPKALGSVNLKPDNSPPLHPILLLESLKCPIHTGRLKSL